MTARRGLTRKQAALLRFVGAYFARNGFSPTYKEIAAGLGMSPNSRAAVGYGIQRLAKRGYLVNFYGTRQSIVLTYEGEAYCKDFPATVTYGGSASEPSIPSRPARPDGSLMHEQGQGRRAGIHFRPVEGEG